MSELIYISTKLAAALLVQKGELSIPEIRALPFVENDEAVLFIIKRLTNNFEVKRYQRRIVKNQEGWEDIISLDHASKDQSTLINEN